MEEEMKKQIIELLRLKFDCEAIVLFGSYARNTQREDSDIDIAIKSKRTISKIDIFDMTQDLERITKKDIDLVDLNQITDVFRYEILMNGETLYCEDDVQFDLYKLDMFREYFELNESRKYIVNRVKEGGTIYGK